MNTDALEEICKFIVKQVNTLVNKRVIDIERQCCVNAQYSRRECLEVAGIPRHVSNKNFESKVLKVFSKLVARSSLVILRYVIISQTMIESLSNFSEEKIVIRSCQLRGTYEK